MNNPKDDLGNRMKEFESMTTKTSLMRDLPVYARIDGRAFHTFCRGLDKPFDLDFVKVMQTVCKDLVEKTNATIGYVQSDEISLGWEDMSKAPFDGRLFKLESVLASMATTSFILNCIQIPKLKERVEKLMPNFDCRVFQLPSMTELANAFIWRENDAFRNSVSMLAQANFSHKQLQGKSSAEMQEMLFQEKGINYNDLDPQLKRGTYFRRVKCLKKLDKRILDKMPINKRPKLDLVERSMIKMMDFPIMKSCPNKLETYFGFVEPEIVND